MSRVPDAAGDGAAAAPVRSTSRGHVRAALPTRLAPAARSIDAAMDRFAAGEQAAFTEVYAAVLPHLVRALGRLTRQRAAAEDLAQETMLRAGAVGPFSGFA